MNTLVRKLITVTLIVGSAYSVTNCRYTTKNPVTNKTIAKETIQTKQLQKTVAELAKVESQIEAGITTVPDSKLTQYKKDVETQAEEAVSYLQKLNPANWTTTTQMLASGVVLAGLVVGVDFGVNKLIMNRDAYTQRAYNATTGAIGSYLEGGRLQGAYQSAKTSLGNARSSVSNTASNTWNWLRGKSAAAAPMNSNAQLRKDYNLPPEANPADYDSFIDSGL